MWRRCFGLSRLLGLFTLQRPRLRRDIGMLASQEAMVVYARRLRVVLVDCVAHNKLQFAFRGGERQLLGLLRSYLQSDGPDAVSLAVALGLVYVLTVGKHLDILEDNLRYRILPHRCI